MTPEQASEWRMLARNKLSFPIPRSVLNGSAQLAARYRDDAAVVAKVVAGAYPSERFRLALMRMEGLQ